MLEQIRQGMCACFVYLSQQISTPEDHLAKQRRLQTKLQQVKANMAKQLQENHILNSRISQLERALAEECDKRVQAQKEVENVREHGNRRVSELEKENRKCVDLMVNYQNEAMKEK